jgi:thiosulfate/3-mercaptopyruvate sulfurtransferase
MQTSPRVIPHLVQASDLAALLREPNVRVVDVRWRLGNPAAGPAAYAEGHVPGAVFADIDKDLAAPPGECGRHPLPTGEAFASVMQRLGIGDETRVIAYDDQGGATAARLWFLLRYFGHETGAVLDGGIEAWTRAGYSLETTSSNVPPSTFRAVRRPELVLDHAAVQARLGKQGMLLLDARGKERFRGDNEPIDPQAGHIPSAVSAPFAGNLDAGSFLSEPALYERYRALGALEKETAVYCGSGVTACHDLLALAILGMDTAQLYAGSWSEWSRDPKAPVAVGD